MKTMNVTSSTLLAFAFLFWHPATMTLAFRPITLSTFGGARRATTTGAGTTVILSASLQQNVEKRLSPATTTTTTRRRRRRRYNVIEQKDPNSLTFSGQIVKTSRPLLSSSASIEDKERLIEFFKSAAARDTLFVSDEEPIPVNPIPNALFREWQMETKRLGVQLPTREAGTQQQQSIMQLCSKGISFSGLTVETTVNCGAKLIEYCPDNDGLPAYEFTMINDSTNARGPRPLLWIYNQVMGLVQSKRGGGRQQKTTTSLCRIALVPVDEQGDGSSGLAIDFESSFQVKMNFPSFLLRILPVSKSRAEQQGSAAVTRFVQKGVVDSLHRFERAFLDSQKLAP